MGVRYRTAEVVAVDGSARVRYEKFARQLTPNTVEINVTQPPDGRPAQLHVDGSYLGSMTIKSIVPEPDTTTIADNGYVFGVQALVRRRRYENPAATRASADWDGQGVARHQ